MGRPALGDERREQILTAFERCIIRDGLDKTSLQDVADEASLPRPLVRHFAGNREDMIDLLVERMFMRAEEDLDRISPKDRAGTLDDYIEFVFTKALANDVTNSIIVELWHLARRDDFVRNRLRQTYDRMCTLIAEQMSAESLGRDDEERQEIAYALMALAYGDASFMSIGMETPRSITIRQQADEIIGRLRKD